MQILKSGKKIVSNKDRGKERGPEIHARAKSEVEQVKVKFTESYFLSLPPLSSSPLVSFCTLSYES